MGFLITRPSKEKHTLGPDFVHACCGSQEYQWNGLGKSTCCYCKSVDAKVVRRKDFRAKTEKTGKAKLPWPKNGEVIPLYRMMELEREDYGKPPCQPHKKSCDCGLTTYTKGGYTAWFGFPNSDERRRQGYVTDTGDRILSVFHTFKEAKTAVDKLA